MAAKGIQTNSGIDYSNTFSFVVKTTIVRIVITLVVSFGWKNHQVDINNAFLNGGLRKEVYITQPEGFERPGKWSHVCKLTKPLYGLEHAPKAWFNKLITTLLARGLDNSVYETIVFVLQNEDGIVYLLTYVDDVLIIGTKLKYIQDLFLRSWSS